MVLTQRDEFLSRFQHLVGSCAAADEEVGLGWIASEGHTDSWGAFCFSGQPGDLGVGRQRSALVAQVDAPADDVSLVLETGVRRTVGKEEDPALGHGSGDGLA